MQFHSLDFQISLKSPSPITINAKICFMYSQPTRSICDKIEKACNLHPKIPLESNLSVTRNKEATLSKWFIIQWNLFQFAKSLHVPKSNHRITISIGKLEKKYINYSNSPDTPTKHSPKIQQDQNHKTDKFSFKKISK